MDSPRILHVASEAFPLAKSGGLGDVVGALPGSLSHLGESTAIFMPAYSWILRNSQDLADLGVDLEVPTGNGPVHGRILRTHLPGTGVDVLLFQSDALFYRDNLYGENGNDYPDNPYRFGVFARAALEMAKAMNWQIDIFHAHDWQAALLPIFLRTFYEDDPCFSRSRSVLTIHNLAYQGWAYPGVLEALGLAQSLFHHHLLECHSLVNLLKGGIVFADQVTTVSPRYAEEIRTPQMGWGLDNVLRSRADHLTGVLNGVDLGIWDPNRDPHLPRRYDINSWQEGKAEARAGLANVGLNPVDSRPLVGFIGRLTGQKGVDLLLESVPDLVESGGRLILLGTGDPSLESSWRDVAHRYSGSVGAQITYDERLAHLVQAGADMLVMPSRFEPCGLNQMYALRYGTIPVVHGVGGLQDTVFPATAENLASGRATGFHFPDLSRDGILNTFRHAFTLHSDHDQWARLVTTGMRQDFSWTRSAQAYIDLYQEVSSRPDRHMPLKLLPQFPRPAERPVSEDEQFHILRAFRRPYGIPVLRLMVQSPTNLFSYWEIPESLRPMLGDSPRLELENVTRGTRHAIPLDNPSELGDYWFHVEPDHTYQVTLVSEVTGLPCLESNPVQTPRVYPSDSWATDDAASWVTLDQLSARARDAFIERYKRLLECMGLASHGATAPSSMEMVPLPSSGGPPFADVADVGPSWISSVPSSIDFGLFSMFGRVPSSDVGPVSYMEGWK